MERLVNNQPGPHESWRELAEHSLTHDNLNPGWLHTGNSTRVEFHADGSTHYVESDGTEKIVYPEKETANAALR